MYSVLNNERRESHFVCCCKVYCQCQYPIVQYMLNEYLFFLNRMLLKRNLPIRKDFALQPCNSLCEDIIVLCFNPYVTACARAFYEAQAKVILCARRRQELERVKMTLMESAHVISSHI